MCQGAENQFFNRHTNVASSLFVIFDVKGLLQTRKNVKNTLLFNVLSFIPNRLLAKGNTVAGITELTTPVFSVPTHAFLFNAGNIDKKFYMDTLQLEKFEYNLMSLAVFCFAYRKAKSRMTSAEFLWRSSHKCSITDNLTKVANHLGYTVA